MRNKKLLIGATVVILFTIILLAVLLLTGGKDQTLDESGPFADTRAERQFASTSAGVEDMYGTYGNEWVRDEEDNNAAPAFRLIAEGPVVGAVAINKMSGSSSVEQVRYIEHDTGHFKETPLATIGTETLLSDKTILRLGEALLTKNGNTMLARYLDEKGESIFTFLGTLENSASSSKTVEGLYTSTKLVGRPLANNILTAAFSPNNTSVFYIVPTDEGSAGYIESAASGVRTEVWSSPLRNLTASWNYQGAIIVYTNPSSAADGFAWTINPTTLKVQVILGDQRGLAVKHNPVGTKILYSLQEQEGGVTSLRVLDLATGEITNLPEASLVEKCAWGTYNPKYLYCAVPRNLQSTEFLENWYQGMVVSDDVLWRFNTDSGTAKQVFDPHEHTGNVFDIIDLSLSPSDRYLVFRTKQHNLLWAMELPETVQVNEEEVVTNQ